MADQAVRVEEEVNTGFVRGLGLWDSTMIVAGSMIGSGIFLVAADIARTVGSAGLIIAVWLVTGLLTIAGALAYGELASMMPRSGGVYVYLKEAFSPLLGFLYGWTLFAVIQSGSLAAVAVAFAKYLGVLVPGVSPTSYVIEPINISHDYALSLSTQQLIAIIDAGGSDCYQHTRASTGKDYSERIHFGQDSGRDPVNPVLLRRRVECGRGCAQFRRSLDSSKPDGN